jgi:DNA-binding transcriptional ArsR family regulator
MTVMTAATKIEKLETAIALGYRRLQSQLKTLRDANLVTLRIKLNKAFQVLKAEAQRLIELYKNDIATIENPTPANPKIIRSNLDERDPEYLEFLEDCHAESKANPRKLLNVSLGFDLLTVDNKTWSIVYDREEQQWLAYVDESLIAKPTSTKKEMLTLLLA